MSEMAMTADHIIVIGRGRIIADAPVADIIGRAAGTTVRVRTPGAATLAELVSGPGVTVTSSEPGLLEVTGSTAVAIGEAAAGAGLVLHELTPVQGSLEDAYMQLTAEDVEFHSASFDSPPPGSAPGAVPGSAAAPSERIQP
jgi:ABC-2 type transport system ATP-binding protein